MFRRSTAILVMACLAAPGAALAQLYSWTDEEGNVHYGDSIPPEYRDQEQRVLRDGLEVERIDRALTEEEREAIRRQQEMEAEAERAAALQAEQDQRLLRLYGSVEEIERLRDDRVAGLQSQIRLTANNLEDLERNLERVEESIERYDDREDDAPDHLLRRYDDLARQISDHQRHLMEREDQMEQVRARFNAEIERFTELQEERQR
ncbi:DUF4124 domain-containing protein [Natronospira bacteriovora]|uniref:DUF4124 domain-containing protein n=1 Tax=Natronospira bacteriovora TaxID=3069753 RepID=A0ABU0W859_9GAMM|nr:DUF4124 domain-containing protein [Natronospira sp. AB-CW4]MDQ2070103.1 DUF4124 domain-containing protein [Natronospira sp. AB-CW4]